LIGADRFLPERKYLPLILAGSGAICLVLALLLVILLRGPASSPGADNGVPDEFVREGESDHELYGADGTESAWVVYVTGEVMRPGVYEIPQGGRINDAVRMAGGFTALADREAVNLAEEAEDGIHIRVPERTVEILYQIEENTGLKGEALNERRPAGGELASRGQGVNDAKEAKEAKEAKNSRQNSYVSRPSLGGASGVSEKININEATEDELQRLSGIGPVLAGAIVAYRETNGPFSETEDLIKVKGIGRKRFESVKDFVTVSR
jgi:competence protein ComEA